MRVVSWILAICLVGGGLIGSFAYIVALLVNAERGRITNEFGAVFAFSVVGVVAGALWLLALARRMPSTLRLPNEWVTLALLLLFVVFGAVLSRLDILVVATPFLALLAIASLFMFFAKLVTKWAPDGKAFSREVTLPALWGGIGAPVTAGTLQLVTVIALVLGIAGGLYLADDTLLTNLELWVDELVEAGDFDVLKSPTIAFGAISLLGVAAPLSEELFKFLGVYILFRNRFATKYGLFVAGAASGLGFAVVETLGYALMSGDGWALILLLRSPVAIIHMACTAIVALGWYQQRMHGGNALLGFFCVAVLLHAAWNSLFVSLMLVAIGMDTTGDIDPLAGGTLFVVIMAMGALLAGATAWLFGNARRLGREAKPLTDNRQSIPGLHDVRPGYSYQV